MSSKKKIFSFVVLSFVVLLFAFATKNDVYPIDRFLNSGNKLDASICSVKDDYPAIVTVVSDDGVFESGVILNSLAETLDIQVTVAGYVNRIAQYVNEWKLIEENGYVELVSHSYSHLKIDNEDTITTEDLYHEYGEAKLYYEENFVTPSFCFITPNNVTTNAGYAMFEEVGILAVRQGTRGTNSLFPEYGHEPGQLLNLKTRGIGDEQTTEGRNKWVDEAINTNTWLIEMWHDISADGDKNYQPISTVHAREHLKYMKERQDAGEIWVAPFTQAVSYIYQRDNCTIDAYEYKNQLAIILARDNSELPWDDFNVPLSVKIDVPQDWKSVELISGETEDAHNTYDVSENGTVIVSMYPSDVPVILKRVA